MKVIILSGGCGSRLYPLSTKDCPKQFLPLFFEDKHSLLQKTISRILSCNIDDILCVTNTKYTSLVDEHIKELKLNKEVHVLSEPFSKNTAPAICAALEFYNRNDFKDDIVIILPSDHFIQDIEQFNKTVKNALLLAENNYIVTLGIKPDYPETGYGYIKTSKFLQHGFMVEKFVEKPDLETAKKYLGDGGYYWNGGIFIGKISAFMAEFQNYAPEIIENLKDMKFDNCQIDCASYKKMPSISIDYALMEKSERIALVPLLSDWSDLGSFRSLYSINRKDNNNNVIVGNVITRNVVNSLIYAPNKTLDISNLNNAVLIENNESVLLCCM